MLDKMLDYLRASHLLMLTLRVAHTPLLRLYATILRY